MPKAQAVSDNAQTPPRGFDDEARRAFLRTAGHELRTPLNAIIGFAEVLRQELHGPLGSPRYAEYAGLIGLSGERMLRLVNRVVEILRLEGGTAELEVRAQPLAGLAAEALLALRREAEERRVPLLAEDLAAPWVLADAHGLKTVLYELLENALVHSSPGEPVMVRARRAGGEVRIEVEDHGPGFDPADTERLMRPFEQGERERAEGREGAGLGLTIAGLLCRAMGGRLELRTAPGEGVTAAVRLRAA